MTPTDTLVRGTIVFEPAPPDLAGATVRVRLEDVGRADASARVVSERSIEDPAENASGDGIPFALPGSRGAIDADGRYALGVHVDVDGDGEVSAGDYVNTQSYPVLTGGHPDEVEVRVEEVG